MKFNEYLESLLSKSQIMKIKSLKERCSSKKIIVITGKNCSGKSTLKKVLRKKGYHVFEDYEVEYISLDEPLKNMIPNLGDYIS